MATGGREAHEGAILRSLSGHPGRHEVTLADHVVDDEMDVRKGGAEHLEHGPDTAQAAGSTRRRTVVHIVGGVQLGDEVVLAVVDHLLDEPPVQGFALFHGHLGPSSHIVGS